MKNPEIKVGDLVRHKDGKPFFGTGHKKELRVAKVTSHTAQLEGAVGSYYLHYLVKVEEEPKVPPCPYKVGDKVRRLSGSGRRTYPGFVGVITKIERYPKGLSYLLIFAAGETGRLWDKSRDQWELVEEQQPQPENPLDATWDASLRGPRMSEATGNVILKYQMPVLEQFTMELPSGAEILRVQDQGGMFWLWAKVDTRLPNETRRFRAFKTGGQIPDGLPLRYIGFCAVFVQMELGLYIFEEI